MGENNWGIFYMLDTYACPCGSSQAPAIVDVSSPQPLLIVVVVIDVAIVIVVVQVISDLFFVVDSEERVGRLGRVGNAGCLG
jgi:hypothetical protein